MAADKPAGCRWRSPGARSCKHNQNRPDDHDPQVPAPHICETYPISRFRTGWPIIGGISCREAVLSPRSIWTTLSPRSIWTTARALLTEHVVLLRAALWQMRARHPFAHPLDWAGDPGDQARSFGEQ
jgi:hypothetical protein